MSSFTKWLVNNEYVTSEDADTIRGEMPGPKIDTLYEIFLNEGNINE